MSIEIEVGLENAARVKPAPEEIRLDERPKGLANPNVRGLLLIGGGVVLAVVVGLFVYYHNRARVLMTRRSMGTSLRWPRRFTGEWRKFWWTTTRR